MPIYEYHCTACDKTFEVFQKISDPPLAECPDCGKQVRRLISQTSFALKGGGWYKDGYSSAGSAKKSGTGESTTKKPETKKESS